MSNQNPNLDQTVFSGDFYGEDFMINDEFMEESKFDEEQQMGEEMGLEEFRKKISTAGWFVSDETKVLLAHDDCSCSLIDPAGVLRFKPPTGFTRNMWRDCWIINAPGSDGSFKKYVVAASAGNTIDSGFCSWDYYSKEVNSYRMDDHNKGLKWWYNPCEHYITSTASLTKTVRVFDIRSGNQFLKWEVCKPVVEMNYSSPIQWRNRGTIVVAEEESFSIWDLNFIKRVASSSSSGQKVTALHINNSDAETGGGVRKRISSSSGNDGVFCTNESINVLDFREKNCEGIKIPTSGTVNITSAFCYGYSIYTGGTSLQSSSKDSIQIKDLDIRFPIATGLPLQFSLPRPEGERRHVRGDVAQVWGNSKILMADYGDGVLVFDILKNKEITTYSANREMYHPYFDFLESDRRLLKIPRNSTSSMAQIPLSKDHIN